MRLSQALKTYSKGAPFYNVFSKIEYKGPVAEKGKKLEAKQATCG